MSASNIRTLPKMKSGGVALHRGGGVAVISPGHKIESFVKTNK